MKKLIVIFLIMLLNKPIQAQVLINEYSASNFTSFKSSLGVYSDWIELYNTGNKEVNLRGYYLSEDDDNPKKFKINDNLIIMPKSFVRIYASGRDITVKDSIGNLEVHTNFNITQSKQNQETLILLNQMGKVVDFTKIRKTQLDHSVGRFPDGSKNWFFLKIGTPGNQNIGKKYTKYSDTPKFSLSSGFYDQTLRLMITTKEKNVKIYFTLDGSEPSPKSKVYDVPIDIEKTTVVKALAVSSDQNLHASYTNYATYFINEKTPLMVVSISGMDSLLSLANGNKDLRPFGSVEIYKDKKLIASSYGEFNKLGNDSWKNSQRGIDFECVDGMGYSNELRSKLFKLSERDSFQKVMFRPSGDDNYPDGSGTKGGGAHLRDAFIQNLVKKSDMQLDVRTGEKMILYINGKYWGVYELRERVNDRDFIDFYYSHDRKDIQMLTTWGATTSKFNKSEALDYWEDLHLFVKEHDLSIPENYRIIEEQVDLTSFVDYLIANTATVATDWINYNTAWWRGLNPQGKNKKWRYTLWDNDATFGYFLNYTRLPDTTPNAKPCDIYEIAKPRIDSLSVIDLLKSGTFTFEDIKLAVENGQAIFNSDSSKVIIENASDDINGHILMFKKLMDNDKFKAFFLNRYTDLINRTFNKDSMLAYLNEQYDLIKLEMPRHIERWGGTMQEWEKNVQDLRDYISKRDQGLKNGLKACYDLKGPFKLTINSEQSNAVTLKINSLDIAKLPYNGIYFGGIENHLKAVVADSTSYQFMAWTSDKNSKIFKPNSRETQLSLSGDTQVNILTNQIISNVNRPFTNFKPFPNTFHYKLNVSFVVIEPSEFSFYLFDIQGKPISTIVESKFFKIGKQELELNLPKNLNQGQYYLVMKSNNYQESAKVIKF
ncbi:Chitobiase/beta-hexosaminidase C-terminal domain containing protein [Spirosomataceae bacterium]